MERIGCAPSSPPRAYPAHSLRLCAPLSLHERGVPIPSPPLWIPACAGMTECSLDDMGAGIPCERGGFETRPYSSRPLTLHEGEVSPLCPADISPAERGKPGGPSAPLDSRLRGNDVQRRGHPLRSRCARSRPLALREGEVC